MSRRQRLVVLVVLSLVSCHAGGIAAPDLSGGLHVLFVLSDPYAANVGVWSTYFDRLGYDLTFAGVAETIAAYDPAGAPIVVDCRMDEIADLTGFDAIVLATQPVDPGLIAVVGRDLRTSPRTLELLKEADTEGLAMYVGASAFGLMLDAGLVAGRTVLCHSALLPACRDAGGNCAASRSTDAPLRDGNLVTGTSWFAFPVELVEAVGLALDTAQSGSRSLSSIVAEDILLASKMVEYGSPAVAAVAWGGARGDGATAVCPAPSGANLAGYTFSGRGGTADMLVMACGESGELVWARAIGGPGRDYAQGICPAPDGGSYVAGYTTSAGSGDEDGLVVRLSQDGTVIWMRTLGGAGSDMLFGICQASDGGIAVCGATERRTESDLDAWVVRLGSDGSELWSSTVGSSRNERALAIVECPDGTWTAAGSTTTTSGNADGQIFCFSASGEPVAAGQTGWTTANVFEDLAFSTARGTVAIGHSASSRLEAEGMVLASFDTAGTRLWVKRFEQAGAFDFGTGVLALESGDLLVCGSGTALDPTHSDLLLARFDAAGKLAWKTRLGESGVMDRAEAMCQLSDSRVVVVGHTEAGSGGGADVVIVFVDPDASL